MFDSVFSKVKSFLPKLSKNERMESKILKNFRKLNGKYDLNAFLQNSKFLINSNKSVIKDLTIGESKEQKELNTQFIERQRICDLLISNDPQLSTCEDYSLLKQSLQKIDINSEEKEKFHSTFIQEASFSRFLQWYDKQLDTSAMGYNELSEAFISLRLAEEVNKRICGKNAEERVKWRKRIKWEVPHDAKVITDDFVQKHLEENIYAKHLPNKD